MPIHDFATVTAFESVDYVEVRFPPDRGLTDFLKKIPGTYARWMADRRCWKLAPKGEGGTQPAEIVEAIRIRLLEGAPSGWAAAMPSLARLACVMRSYEIAVGEGGIRVGFPPGHPGEYHIKDVKGAVEDGRKWLVPSNRCGDPAFKKILERIVREDKAKVEECLELADRRRLEGSLAIPPHENHVYHLEHGRHVFADPSFLKESDPNMPNDKLVEFPFKVAELKAEEDFAIRVKLDYVTGEEAYRILRNRAATKQDQPLVPERITGRMIRGRWVHRRIQ
jgi:hypothetical protein